MDRQSVSGDTRSSKRIRVEESASESSSIDEVDESFNSKEEPVISDLEYKKELFYTIGADTEIYLAGGKTVKFSKSVLCYHVKNDAFLQLFYGPLQSQILEFDDLDADEFKLFLDLLMGFEKYDQEKALTIFPTVWKYQIEDAISQCLQHLKPKEMNSDVCQILNLGCFFDCDTLIESTMKFLSQKYRYRVLLENEEFCFLLWPDSIAKLLKFVQMDSHLTLIIIRWGDNFLKDNDLENRLTLRNLFKKYGIMKEITPFCFETMDLFVNFVISPLANKFFTIKEIESYKPKYKDCQWLVMKKSDTYTEEFRLEKRFNAVDGVSKIDVVRSDLIILSEPEEDTFFYCTLSLHTDGCKGSFDQHLFFGKKFDPQNNGFAIEVANCKNVKFVNLKVKWTFKCDCRILKKNKLFSESKKSRFVDVNWSKNNIGDTFVSSFVL